MAQSPLQTRPKDWGDRRPSNVCLQGGQKRAENRKRLKGGDFYSGVNLTYKSQNIEKFLKKLFDYK